MFKNIKTLSPFALILLFISFTMSVSQSMMTTAYPLLMKAFNVETSTVQWLTTGFMIAMTLVMPLSPWLLNNIKLKPLLNGIVLSFLVGTAIAMLTPNFTGIIIGRFIQGMAVGALFPTFQSVIMENTPKNKRGTAMGVVGLVMGSALAVGPIISGVILQLVSWRLLFAIFLVALLGLIVIGQKYIENSHQLHYSKFDWLSAGLLVGLAGILYAISNFQKMGFNLAWWLVLVISLILLASFAIRQSHLSEPFLDLRVFKYSGFLPGLLLTGISYSGLIIATVLMPLFYQNVFQFSPLVSGLLMIPAALFLSNLNPKAGNLLNKIGLRKLVYIGMSMMILGYLVLALLGSKSWFVVIIGAMLLEGGNAFIMMPAITAANNALPEKLVSHGTALITTVRQVMGSISVVIVTLLVTSYNTHLEIGTSLQSASAWLIIIPIIGFLLALRLPKKVHKTK
ncbi:MFS transporter [Holzapfeliella sp. He02]|uniref:MFS transporter n=1 Tax=Holzapfeliella saturejae TaxID=3082953 RepID=A0ABU8SIB9_9LACO